MQRKRPADELAENRRGPEEERRLLDERLARERRHHPVAGFEDVMDEAERVGLVGLPRIVSDEAEQDPRGEQR